MCISMICIYLTKQLNKLQQVGLPTSTSGFVKLYAKVKMATETCQMVKKHYDKSNGNFWDIYGYVKKHNHKFHNRFWNAYSYLKRRIMEFGIYLRTVIPGRGSRKLLATPPAIGYKRRAETWGWQSGSHHSHSMVCVMFLLLNLLFLFCMHLLRLGYLTVFLIYMLFGFIALNLIWLYDYWHIYIYIWLPTYGLSQSKRCKHFPECRYSQDGRSTDPFCHVSLTLASSPSLLFPFFFSLFLSPLLSLYFISLSVISHEPGIAGNSVLGDCLRRLFLFLGDLEPDIAGNSVSGKDLRWLFLAFFEDSDPGIAGNSVPDRNLQCSTSSFLLVGYEPDIVGNSVSGKDF